MATVKDYGLALGVALGLTACVVEGDNRRHNDNNGGGGERRDHDEGENEGGRRRDNDGGGERNGGGGGGERERNGGGGGGGGGGRGGRYSNLPDKGYLDGYMTNGFNNAEYILPAGRYKLRDGKFHSGGGNLTLKGAGIGQTVIEGDILLKGNNYVLTGITVVGSFEVHGNDCTFDVDFKGSKTVKGTNNQFLTSTPPPAYNPPPPPPPAYNPPPPPPAYNPPPPPPAADPNFLPDKGYLDQYLTNGFQGSYVLEPGIYALRDGKLHTGGGNLTIQGAGIGKTIIKGDILLKGNNYIIRGITLRGDFELHGNNCTINIDFKGSKTMKGVNNQILTGDR